MTATLPPYPDSPPRRAHFGHPIRLFAPPRAVIAAPTHPPTSPEAVLSELADFVDVFASSTYVIATQQVDDLHQFVVNRANAIVNLHRVNDIRRLNKFFEAVHEKLVDGGNLVVCVETLGYWRRRMLRRFPAALAYPLMGTAFVLKRVLPKLRWTRRLYFAATKGRNRLLSRAETMGRLYCCGFEVVETKRIDHLVFVIARKCNPPSFDMAPSYGPIFRMRRVGRDGVPIHVYKLRTMYPYAEYLQQYVYEKHALAAGGKFNDDFRVTPWGRIIRRFWIDEIPMLINWFRGELKLVGVRPLSFHYESLYPEDQRERRRKAKPGLIPPFYADLPKSFDAIVESERRYLTAYQRNPIATDVKYFLRAVRNILFRGARSH